jgi:predicted esterase
MINREDGLNQGGDCMKAWRSVVGSIACGVAISIQAADPTSLVPGRTLEFDIAGTPPSLADLVRNNPAGPARVTVKLPDSYETSRLFPVLVFLSGGDGGTGGELHQAEPLLGGTDYILCNMPLYKRDIEGETYDQRLSITPVDGPYALPAFRVLVDELHRRVPNIDDSRSVIAGFSNGANSIGLMLWAGDEDLVGRFSTYLLIEGGFWMASDRPDPTSELRFRPATFAGLRDKRVLLMYGDQTEPSDRIPFIQDARKTASALRRAGVAAAEMPMPGISHDFPAHEIARARAWILGSP